MAQPKFSIVTVCYNAGDKLYETIQTALKQNYDNYEITIEDQPYTITLTISPREIYVNLYEIENKVYDGQYISYLNPPIIPQLY